MAWRVPTLRDVKADGDFYALQVLAAVLDGYDGARLGKNLVRGSRVAVTAGAGYDGTARANPCSWWMAPGRRQDGGRRGSRAAEIARIQNDGVSEDGCAGSRPRPSPGRYKRDSLMGQAMEIGMGEMVGLSWKDDAYMLERIRAVTDPPRCRPSPASTSATTPSPSPASTRCPSIPRPAGAAAPHRH